MRTVKFAAGRYVFGVASILLGIANLALHDQLTSNWTLPGDAVFLVVASLAQIAGGAAIQFPKTERLGALVLGSVYLVFAFTFVPSIVAQPGVYYTWGNIFYRLASVCGAAVAYCMAAPATPNAKVICKASVVIAGLCYASFAIEQVEYLARTSSLVPKWVPPNGIFWTWATTVAFGLAGISLVTGFKALLASRLTTLMFVIFVITIWIPNLIADPKTHSNWAEGIETLLIAGAGWIVSDYLGRKTIA
jgi:uncharacterized membrane protein YphA (DoxX/SURF4 family)